MLVILFSCIIVLIRPISSNNNYHNYLEAYHTNLLVVDMENRQVGELFVNVNYIIRWAIFSMHFQHHILYRTTQELNCMKNNY